MDNWDYFKRNLTVAQGSEGTLQRQADIYAESWQAASDKVKAAAEGLYQTLLDDDFFIDLTNGFAKVLELLDKFIDNIGGLKTLLPQIGMLLTMIFKDSLLSGFTKLSQGLFMLSPAIREAEKQNQIALKRSAWQETQKMYEGSDTSYGNAMADMTRREGEQQIYLIENAEKLNDIEQQRLRIAMQRQKALDTEVATMAQELQLAQDTAGAAKAKLLNRYGSVQGRGANGTFTSIRTSFNAAEKEITADQTNIEELKRIQQSEAFKKVDLNSSEVKRFNEIVQTSGLGKGNLITDSTTADAARSQSFNAIDNLEQRIETTINNITQDLKMPEDQLREVQNLTKQATTAIRDTASKQAQLSEREKSAAMNYLNQRGVKTDEDLAKAFGDEKIIQHKFKKTEGQSQKDYLKARTAYEQTDKGKEWLASERGQEWQRQERLRNGERYNDVYGITDETNMPKENPEKQMKTAQERAQGLASSMMMVTQSVMLAQTAISGFTNVLEILNDEQKTTGEKIAAIGETLISLIPSLLMGISMISSSLAAGANMVNQSLGIIGIIAAAAILLANIAIAIVKKVEEMSPEGKLKKAKEESKKLQEELQSATEAAEDLKKSFDEYETIVDKLKNCVKGTEEWRDALKEVNDSAREIIRKYPALLTTPGAITFENGILNIDENAIEDLEKQLDEVVINKQLASQWSDLEVRDREYEISREDLEKRILKEAEKEKININIDNLSNIQEQLKILERNDLNSELREYLQKLVDLIEEKNKIDYSAMISMASLITSNNDIGNSKYTNEIVKIIAGWGSNKQNEYAYLKADQKVKELKNLQSTLARGDYDTKSQMITAGSIVNFARDTTAEEIFGITQTLIEERKEFVDSLDNALKAYAEQQGYSKAEFKDYAGVLWNKGKSEIRFAEAGQTEYSNKDVTWEELFKSYYTKEFIDRSKQIGKQAAAAIEGFATDEDRAQFTYLLSGQTTELFVKDGNLVKTISDDVQEAIKQFNDFYNNGKDFTERIEKLNSDNFNIEEEKSRYSATARELMELYEGNLSNYLKFGNSLMDIERRLTTEQYIEFKNSFESLLNELTDENVRKQLIEQFGNIDVAKGGQQVITDLTNSLKNNSIEIDQTTEQWINFINTLNKLTPDIALRSLSELTKSVEELSKAAKDLTFGEVISDESYNTLKKYNAELTKSFIFTKSGWAYIGSQAQNQIQEVMTKSFEEQFDASVEIAKQVNNYTSKQKSNSINVKTMEELLTSDRLNIDKDAATIEALFGDIQTYQELKTAANDGSENARNALQAEVDKLFTQTKTNFTNYQNGGYDMERLFGLQFTSLQSVEQANNLWENFKNNGILDRLKKAGIDINIIFSNALKVVAKTENSLKQAANDKLIDYYDQLADMTNTVDDNTKKLKLFERKAKLINQGIKTNTQEIVEYIRTIDGYGEKSSQELANFVKGLLAGDKAALDQLENFSNEQKDYLLELLKQQIQYQQDSEDLFEEYINNVNDLLKEWDNEIDKSVNKFEHLMNMLNTYRDILNLFNGQIKSNTFLKDWETIIEGQSVAIKSSIKMAQQEEEEYEKQMKSAKKAQDKLLNGRKPQDLTGEEKEKYDEISAILADTTNKFYQAEEKALEALKNGFEQAKQLFEDQLDAIIDNFQKNLGISLSEAQRDYNKKNEENYIKDYQRIYELNKLNADLQKKMDETSNVKAKQKLKDFQKQINDYQKDGVKMSKYELEYLQKQYDLEVARIALEEARNAKTQVRLTQDNEGNWGYIYTAGESKEAQDALQNYSDKLQAVAELQDKTLNDSLDGLYKEIDDFNQKYKEIVTSTEMDETERQQRLTMLIESHEAKMREYGTTVDKVLKNNESLYESESKTQDDNVKSIIASIQTLPTEYSKIPGALTTATGEAYKTLTDFTDNYIDTVLNPNNKESFVYKSNEAVNNYKQLINEIANLGGYDDIKDAWKDIVVLFDKKKKDSLPAQLEATEKAFTDTAGGFADFSTKLQGALDEALDKIVKFKKSALLNIGEIQKAIDELDSTEGSSDSSENPEPPDTPVSLTTDKRMDPLTLHEKRDNAWSVSTTKEAIDTNATTKKASFGYDKIDNVKNAINNSKDLEDLKGKVNTMVNDKGFQDSFYNNKEDFANTFLNAIEAKLQKFEISMSTFYYLQNGLDDFNDEFQKLKITGYATGGYTGDWGSEGRLAVLHEKELVLNKEDTRNILSAVDLIRSITQTIDLQTAKMAGGLGTLNPSLAMAGVTPLEQEVTIHAEFPNATDHNEIEEAFNNLINSASQYANRK